MSVLLAGSRASPAVLLELRGSGTGAVCSAATLAVSVTSASMAAKRPYVIVGCFVVGMLLTPPDVISQTLLAIPMWILYEAGMIMARILLPEKAAGKPADAEMDQATS